MWVLLILLTAFVGVVTGFCFGCYWTQAFLNEMTYDFEAEIDEKLKYALDDEDE